ncbi:hypothetical protein F5Y03DRAFT_396201 [Xylaria venustula]|nr:hypothetical protein F5Y03DRAFT_396201 [Xylaria venustula]
MLIAKLLRKGFLLLRIRFALLSTVSFLADENPHTELDLTKSSSFRSKTVAAQTFSTTTARSSEAPKYEVTPVPTSLKSPASSTSSSSSSSSLPVIPETCYKTITDYKHLRTTVQTHRCYTRTIHIPDAPCPTLSCAPTSSDQICPFYIKVSSLTVPCATDCCPTTSTVSRPDDSVPCPSCDPCRIPTEWITYTTGCVGTPTITEINYITPTYGYGYPV